MSFLVEIEESFQDLEAGGFGDGEAGSVVFGEVGDFVKVVAEVEVVPAVGDLDRFVNLDMKVAQFLDVLVRDFRVVEKVVEIGQADLSIEKDPFLHFKDLQLFVEVFDLHWQGLVSGVEEDSAGIRLVGFE